MLTRWAGGREAGVVAREGARQEQVGEAGGGWVAWVPPGLARGGSELTLKLVKGS